MSSPRKRGCFPAIDFEGLGIQVFPAQAGVFPSLRSSDRRGRRLPRASGGVSTANGKVLPGLTSSPRKRGCFYEHATLANYKPVFPAQAGVFLPARIPPTFHCRLPRASGGVSTLGKGLIASTESSPRKRGCFHG